MRNHLASLRHRRKKLKQSNDDPALVARLQIQHNKTAALYKKTILQASHAVWKNFCNEQANTFGPAQKIYSRKFFRLDEVKLEIPSHLV